MELTTTTEHTPATNFFLWQNSSWMNDPKNAIPDEYSSWGSFVKLHDESLFAQIDLLNDVRRRYSNGELDLSTEEGHNERILALIWGANMDLLNGWEKGKGDYSELSKEVNLIRMKLDIKDMYTKKYAENLGKYFAYATTVGIGFFMDIDKGEDLKDADHTKLDIAPSGTSLPERSYYFDEEFKEKREQFLQHLNNVKDMLTKNNVNLVDDFANRVLSFETKLAYINMTSSQSRLYDQYYNMTTLDKLASDVNDFAYNKEKLENYKDDEQNVNVTNSNKDLANIFYRNCFKDLGLYAVMDRNYRANYDDYSKENSYKIALYDGDYFKRLFNFVFDISNKRDLMAFLQYKAINSSAGYCTKELNEEVFDFYARKLHGQEKQKSFEKRTVRKINAWVGECLGRLYVKEYFNEECKHDVENKIKGAMETMKRSLEGNNWLTDSTKAEALKKLSTFTMKIGYPSKWKKFTDLKLEDDDSVFTMRKKVQQFLYKTEFEDKINTPVDKTEWHMTPQTVNAYYNPLINEIVFPAAILQPPFYYRNSTLIDKSMMNDVKDAEGFDPIDAVNYGSIVAIICHEMTHGYDDQGRKFDSTGNMNNWWNDDDVKLFENKTENMTDLVEKYHFVDSKGEEYKMDAKLTMGENLADLGGLTIALRTMLHDPTFRDKEGKPNKTALRLFFRSFATAFRENIKEEMRINNLKTDSHAPADFRGNLCSNIDEFYDAFDVKEDDEMYVPPAKRTRMW
jgi:putative endopeptidase